MLQTLVIKQRRVRPLGFEGRCSIQLSYGRLAPFSRGLGIFPAPHLNVFPALHSESASPAAERAHFYTGPSGGARRRCPETGTPCVVGPVDGRCCVYRRGGAK